ncbi:MAG: excisionase [Neisseria sp.]|nr:excisionase [Neisseria sp.]
MQTVISELIPLSEVKKIWTIPSKKPPSTATIWRYRRKGLIPEPIQVGRDNLYHRQTVIEQLNRHLRPVCPENTA